MFRRRVFASLAVLLAAWPAARNASADPVEHVVGGVPAQAGAWPDAAAMLDGRGDLVCTGVLIAPTLVLTAGHCLGSIRSVLLDAIDYTGSGEQIRVAQQFSYPSWYESYDLAVVVLEEPATVAPRVVASGCARDLVSDGAPVAIVGYGAIDAEGREYDTVLREAMTEVTDHDCSDVERGCQPAVSPGGEIGAGGMGIDACFGDSGGPLYLLTEHGTLLVGITSRAWDEADPPCYEGGIYVRPDAVVDWIESETGVNLPEPTCNLAPEPSAPELVVESGATESAPISPNDPDAGNQHVYEITGPPARGVAEIAPDGTVTYTADADYEGPDELTVRVTDDGVPPMDAEIVLPITVLPPPAGCGCESGTPTGGGALLLAGAALLALRRRYI